ncbi:MAG TPA: prevent-host-death protein [Candidatus Angelobacter sp.]|nr:prevent-host-death protein [Candidatus Angelobacter sp.]
MEKVGIREFRENLATFLESRAPVAITRHGETVGFYLHAPARRTQEEWAEFDRAAACLDQKIAAMGLSEDEFLDDFKQWRASQKSK